MCVVEYDMEVGSSIGRVVSLSAGRLEEGSPCIDVCLDVPFDIRYVTYYVE